MTPGNQGVGSASFSSVADTELPPASRVSSCSCRAPGGGDAGAIQVRAIVTSILRVTSMGQVPTAWHAGQIALLGRAPMGR